MIIGVGIGGHVIKKNAGKTMTTAETESKRQYQRKSNCKKLTINENETDASNKENQGQKDQADDRSEFAVQPGRKVGTTEQSDEKVVYLTLDDGPSKNTQAVLDILDKYNAKATFFVTGAMPEYKDMIKRLMIRDIRSECIHILMITQRCMHLLMHIFRILTRLDSL